MCIIDPISHDTAETSFLQPSGNYRQVLLIYHHGLLPMDNISKRSQETVPKTDLETHSQVGNLSKIIHRRYLLYTRTFVFRSFYYNCLLSTTSAIVLATMSNIFLFNRNMIFRHVILGRDYNVASTEISKIDNAPHYFMPEKPGTLTSVFRRRSPFKFNARRHRGKKSPASCSVNTRQRPSFLTDEARDLTV